MKFSPDQSENEYDEQNDLWIYVELVSKRQKTEQRTICLNAYLKKRRCGGKEVKGVCTLQKF